MSWYIISFLMLFNANANSGEWQTYKSLPEVDVLYAYSDCNDNANGIHQQHILLKFVNKTDANLKLDWQYERYEGEKCNTCNKDEYKYSLNLAANETVAGSCEKKTKELNVFVKHLDLKNYGQFTRFELANLKVTKL